MSKKLDQVLDEMLSTEQAAVFADVDVTTIRRWFDNGLIGGDLIPFGSRVLRRVSRASLVQFLVSQNKKPDQPPG